MVNSGQVTYHGLTNLRIDNNNLDAVDIAANQVLQSELDPNTNQFVSKIPRILKNQRQPGGGYQDPLDGFQQNFNNIRGLAAQNQRYHDQQSIGTTRAQEDLQNLYYQNIKLRDMVLMVVQKLDSFIEKTMIVKERKKQINQGNRRPQNEVYQTKEQELDAYLKQIREDKRSIKKLREELEADPNFERMIESENLAKEQYRRLQQLLDDNMQLKRIHGGQEAVLDTSAQ